MRVHFHEKVFGPGFKIQKNAVYSTSGRRFRKDSIELLEESDREWLETLPATVYTILDEDGPVRSRPEPVVEPERTLSEADEVRKGLEAHEAALATKTVGEEVSRDTKPEPAKVKKGYGKSPEEKEKARRKAISKTRQAQEDSKKKKPSDLRSQILGK